MQQDDETTPIVARSRVKPDGDVTEARLLELIALDDEEDALDFKLTSSVSRRSCVWPTAAAATWC